MDLTLLFTFIFCISSSFEYYKLLFRINYVTENFSITGMTCSEGLQRVSGSEISSFECAAPLPPSDQWFKPAILILGTGAELPKVPALTGSMETETNVGTEAEEIGERLDNLKNNIQALEKPGRPKAFSLEYFNCFVY